MLTEMVMGIVFAGHLSAAAALPFLAWQASVAEAFRVIRQVGHLSGNSVMKTRRQVRAAALFVLLSVAVTWPLWE